ncbi:MAG: 6-carboxytetrahydropterin synthase [Planctomycetes bacterium]|nr:6-carboxytetrahydropterin synthase [Planctomycetota bacterium]
MSKGYSANVFEISVQRVFHASHALLIGGDREESHAHDWRITLVVAGADLDSDGLLCDFHDLEAALDEVIETFQDADLNQTRPFDRINPTAEALAKYIAESVSGRLGDTVHVDRVSVIEAPGCQATYFMPPTHR